MLLHEEADRYQRELALMLPGFTPRAWKTALRGCTFEELQQWKIGWCPVGLHPSLGGRITIPIHDEVDVLVSMTGRLATWERNGILPKWWHVPFPSGRYLFGLNHAWLNVLRGNGALLVEGYWDVIAMHRAGYRQTVGVMGVRAKDDQLLLLLEYCNRLIVLPDQDADEKGLEGARRTVIRAKELGFAARVAETNTPYGDPEKLARFQPELLNRMLSTR